MKQLPLWPLGTKAQKEIPIEKLYQQWAQIDQNERPPFWEWCKGKKDD